MRTRPTRKKTRKPGNKGHSGKSPAARPAQTTAPREGERLSSEVVRRLQETHGNAAVQRALAGQAPDIQRQEIGSTIGKPIAYLSIQSPDSPSLTDALANVENELVPPGQKPGEFEGYAHRIQAFGHVWAQTNLCAVVQDQEGRYHALKTDFPGRSAQAEVTIAPTPHPFKKLQWVNVPGRGDPGTDTGYGSWKQRADRARDLHARWKQPGITRYTCPHSGIHDENSKAGMQRCLQIEFTNLLAQALDIARSEIHIAASEGDHSPDHLVTFDLFMDDAHGKGGARIPTDESTEVSPPTVALGPRAFNSESYVYTLSTAVHETQHFTHAMDAVALLAEWRSKETKKSFIEWLRSQKKKKRITAEQYALAVDMTKGDSPDSEILSHLEGFMASYHRIEVSESPHLMKNIGDMADYYLFASSSIGDAAIARLAAYYSTLDQAHKDRLAEYARAGFKRTKSDHNLNLFWDRLVRDVIA